MMRVARILVILGLLMAALVSSAQTTDGTYRIQVEDVLQIKVYKDADVGNTPVPVLPDGNVSAPFLGLVRAAGKTKDELRDELVEMYRKILLIKDPIVSVEILQIRKIKASVGGAVGRASVYEMRRGETLLDLLQYGGGTFMDGRAELKRAYLRHKGSREVVPIDMQAMLVKGDMSQNYVIQDGDELVVPEENKNRIVVDGIVKQPQVIVYREPMRLIEAINTAGGEVQYHSKFSKVQVIRELQGKPGSYVSIECNLVNFKRKGDASQNILLEPGDIVYVPDSGNPDYNQIGAIANFLFILDRFNINFLGLIRR